MVYLGIVDNAGYKGYSSTVKSLLAGVPCADIMDLSSKDAENRVFTEAMASKITLVSAGDMGLRFFDKISKNKNVLKNIDFILSSDKFYDVKLENLENFTVIAPEDAVREYKQRYGDVKVKGLYADLVASPTKNKMLESAEEFKKENSLESSEISIILSGNGKAFFVGGRVSLPDGSFKENTEEIFAKAGADFVEDGKNGVVVFHGLRSFTKGDKTNDFAPVNAFYNAVKENLNENQIVAFLTKKLDEKGNRVPYLNTVMKRENGIISMERKMKDVKSPAAEYYFLLSEVVKRNLELKATIEQMNFIPEALELGADMKKFKPYIWDLCVESNVDVYRKVLNGRNLKTQKQVFDSISNLNNLISRVEKQR